MAGADGAGENPYHGVGANMSNPTPNGSNGRGPDGRFLAGNPGGPGNPHAKKVAQLKSALLRAVSTRDLRAIIKKLIEQATAGDVQAAKVVLEWSVGKPKQDICVEANVAPTLDLEQFARSNRRVRLSAEDRLRLLAGQKTSQICIGESEPQS